MSRSVAASSSSRCLCACAFDSSASASAALRARTTISSDCSRASRRRARYSSSTWSASRLASSADSIDSSIARRRLSSASAMRGKASLLRRNSVIPNAASVQIISPTFGLTRKLPPPSSSPPPVSCAIRTRLPMSPTRSISEEEGDQAEDERVEDDRLGEGEAEPLDARDLLAHLGLAGDRLDHLAEDVADADARTDRAEAGADAEGDRLKPVGGVSPLGDR